MTPQSHTPVLLAECLELLEPCQGRLYCDATVGLGGHAEAILEASGPDGRLVGIDRDPVALGHAAERLARFGDRVTLYHGEFGDLAAILGGLGVVQPGVGTLRAAARTGVDGLLLDLGVSSLQLDDPNRGFSFQKPAPLDMRMDPTRGETATELLRELSEERLAQVLREYGEQPRARAVARAIKRYVTEVGVPDTVGLARVVAAVLPPKGRAAIHPATQAFMAIRIALNDELGQLRRFLDDFLDVLAPEGRVVVITFHSLEDRLVKRRFVDLTRPGAHLPADLPLTEAQRGTPSCELLTRRARRPSEAERTQNPRARSARLRGLAFRGVASLPAGGR